MNWKRLWLALPIIFTVLYLVYQKPSAVLTQEVQVNINPNLVTDGSQNLMIQMAVSVPEGSPEEVHAFLEQRRAMNQQTLEEAGYKATCSGIGQSCFLPAGLVVTSQDVQVLSKLEGVTFITNEGILEAPKPVSSTAVSVPMSTPWGVTDTNAPLVWSQWTRGLGARVANLDSGVDYAHPELASNWTGGWYDPLSGSPVPVDSNGHGTHVMSTMVGQTVGMAPHAQWVGVRVCSSSCPVSVILDGADWLLDWLVANPGPLVVNNSWGSSVPNTDLYPMVEAWKAAGVIVVFSAGNNGSSCQTAGYPAGGIPNPIAVAAHDVNRNIAYFSSRGQDVYGNNFPDISGPGVGIVGAATGGGYISYNGTSMAAPHVSGAVALLQSLDPGITEPEVRSLLFDTAVFKADAQCGNWSDGNGNNVYGNGFLDVYAAASLVATGGYLEGIVTSTSGEPLQYAEVVITSPGYESIAATQSDGTYKVFLASGTYNVQVRRYGYIESSNVSVNISTNTSVTKNFTLAALQTFTVSGVVESVQVLPDETQVISPTFATVSVVGGVPTPPPMGATATEGEYAINGFVNGTYQVQASTPFCSIESEVTISSANATLDFLFPLQQPQYQIAQTTNTWAGARDGDLVIVDCDDCEAFMVLAKPVEYFGRLVNAVEVNSNGFVVLDGTFQGYSSWQPRSVPDPDLIGQVAPLWVDLDLRDEPSAGVWFMERPEGGFIVEWESPSFGGVNWYHFSLEVFPDGTMLSHYKEAIYTPAQRMQLQGWDLGQYTTGEFPPPNSTYYWNPIAVSCGFFPTDTQYLPVINK